LAEVDLESLFPQEDDDTVLARMLADLPAPPGGVEYNTRAGSVINGLFAPLVFERARVLSYAREVFRQSFVSYATGEFLDQHAQQVGITRGEAQNALAVVTVTGTSGLEITPDNSLFSTSGDEATGEEGLSFVPNETVTIPVGGSVDVTCVCTTAGATGNVSADSITLVISGPDGITQVTNDEAGYGATDSEDDESLRTAISQRLQALAGTGNAAYYRSVALREPEVQTASVDDLWDGNGTVLVSVSGRLTPYVSPDTVERLQNFFDPSVYNIAHFESETWTGGSVYTPALEGQYSRILHSTHTAAAVMSIAKSMNLSRFDDPDDEVILFIKRIGPAIELRPLTIRFLNSDSAKYAETTVAANTMNAVTNVTTRGMLRLTKSLFTGTSGFSWSTVTGVRFTLAATSSSSHVSDLVLDGMRFRRSAGGILTGAIPIGIQATVRSARARTINVSVNMLLDTGLSTDDVEAIISAGISDYFNRLPAASVIRLNEVGNIIHDTRGVVDYSSLTLNSSAANITDLSADEGPVLGTLTLGTI
jgi:uncharacterized phage protein gp47/JayE